MNMDPDSEVIFKEKTEEEGVKSEGISEDTTIRFDFQVLTLAKELANSARQLASRAYYSNDYDSQEKAVLHTFLVVLSKELQLKCVERGCKTLKMAVKTVKIQICYTWKAVREGKC